MSREIFPDPTLGPGPYHFTAQMANLQTQAISLRY
jgi:hypothetical protein